MLIVRALLVIATLIAGTASQDLISFSTQDGGTIFADIYGEGERAVLLAHGGRFNKGSWQKQAKVLEEAGYRVLAFDFRGYGQSHGPGQADVFTAPLYLDVLAAVRYLHKTGAKTVAIIGGSLGGGAASRAVIESEPGEIDRLVLLGSQVDGPPEKLKVRKLFILTRDDANDDGPRLPAIRAQYEKSPEPKEMILLDGSAHAQFIFDTEQGTRLMNEILRFLSKP